MYRALLRSAGAWLAACVLPVVLYCLWRSAPPALVDACGLVWSGLVLAATYEAGVRCVPAWRAPVCLLERVFQFPCLFALGVSTWRLAPSQRLGVTPFRQYSVQYSTAQHSMHCRSAVKGPVGPNVVCVHSAVRQVQQRTGVAVQGGTPPLLWTVHPFVCGGTRGSSQRP